jgi:hypothetical protein
MPRRDAGVHAEPSLDQPNESAQVHRLDIAQPSDWDEQPKLECQESQHRHPVQSLHNLPK